MKEQLFELAKPVWLQGKSEEIHIRAQFRAVFHHDGEDVEKAVCRVATSGIYNLFVNGRFVAYGPARAGKNHFRMDEVSIASFIKKGANVIALEVAGYYVNSYYCLLYTSSRRLFGLFFLPYCQAFSFRR